MLTAQKIEDVEFGDIERLQAMSAKARRRAIDSLEGTAQQKDMLHAYVVEAKTAKPSLWKRIKRGARTLARKAASLFRRVGRFLAGNWGYMLAGTIWLASFIVAPVPTLVGTAFIASSYALLNHDNWFVRAMGRALLDIGAQVIADDVVDALANRKRC